MLSPSCAFGLATLNWVVSSVTVDLLKLEGTCNVMLYVFMMMMCVHV